jgi:hypothetical protein
MMRKFVKKEGDQMRSLLVKLGVIGLIIFIYAEVWGADWKNYAVTDYYFPYYDAQSITRPSKNIVRVWVKYNWTEKGIIDCVEKLGKKYENVSHTIALRGINCTEKMARIQSTTYYDNKGGVISSTDSPSEWSFIIPESVDELLYKEVCK